MAAMLSASTTLPRSHCFTSQRPRRLLSGISAPLSASTRMAPRPLQASYKVEVEHKGQIHVLDVDENESVLEVALDKGLDFPHDCKLGVCMTCPAFLVSGTVDTGGTMLREEVAEKGYRLLCQAYPRSDCNIRTIEEDELLDLQIGSQ